MQIPGAMLKQFGISEETIPMIQAFLNGKPDDKRKMFSDIASKMVEKTKQVFEPLVERKEGETDFHLLAVNNNGTIFINAVFLTGSSIRIDKSYTLEELMKLIPDEQLKM